MRISTTPILYLCVLGTLLGGCTQQAGEDPKKPQPHLHNEVELPSNSPKRPYIKEAVLSLVQRPLMEPVAGKVSYDETQTTRIASPINGRVVSPKLAELGTAVEKGAVLIELDSPDLGQAQSDYATALANLKLAEKAHRRSQELYEGKAIALKDLEQADDSLSVAKAEAERARLRLANLWIKGARENNRYVLRSPIAGTITERNVNPGMEVTPDLSDPLYVVSDIRHLWVFMNVFEKDLGLIHTGQKVLVRVPAHPGQRFPATVQYIGQVVDENTRTVLVRCVLDNPEKKLLPAMYATVDVLSDPDDKALVIPLTAVFTEKETDVVYVALAENHYQKRPIKIGLRLKNQAVVEAGLQPGERLVTEGALQLMAEEAQEEEEDEDQGKTGAGK